MRPLRVISVSITPPPWRSADVDTPPPPPERVRHQALTRLRRFDNAPQLKSGSDRERNPLMDGEHSFPEEPDAGARQSKSPRA